MNHQMTPKFSGPLSDGVHDHPAILPARLTSLDFLQCPGCGHARCRSNIWRGAKSRQATRRQERLKVSKFSPRLLVPRLCLSDFAPLRSFLSKGKTLSEEEEERGNSKARSVHLQQRKARRPRNREPQMQPLPPCAPFAPFPTKKLRVPCNIKRRRFPSNAAAKSLLMNRCIRWEACWARKANPLSSVRYDGGRREKDSTGQQC